MLADVGCCCSLLLLADGQKHQRDSVSKGNLIPASRCVCGIRRSSGGHAVEVGTENVSPGRKVDRRVLAGDLDQVVGLITRERRLFGHWTKPATAAGIDAGDTSFCLQSVRKSRLTVWQAQEVATRHEMEE